MKKRVKIFSLALAALLILSGVGVAAQGQEYRVACIGDSLTYGTGADNIETDSWPAVLASLPGFLRLETLNFGVYGSTVSQVEGKTYTDTTAYRDSLSCEADVYLVMLGSNDTLFPFLAGDFVTGYRELLQTYLDTGARVVVLLPPNMYYDGFFTFLDEDIYKVRAAERSVAEELGLEVIDLSSLSEELEDCCIDGGHFNSEGYAAFAEYIYRQLSHML